MIGLFKTINMCYSKTIQVDWWKFDENQTDWQELYEQDKIIINTFNNNVTYNIIRRSNVADCKSNSFAVADCWYVFVLLNINTSLCYIFFGITRELY